MSVVVNERVLANAVATVSAVLFVACRILTAIAPNLLYAIGSSWFHTFTLDPSKATGDVTFGIFILGLFTFTALAWVVTHTIAMLYNRWSK